MKKMILILAVAVPALAVNTIALETPQIDTDEIVIEVVNDWTLPEKALDLDVMETASGPVVIGIDNGDDVIRIWESGQTSQQMTLPPVSSGHSWGVACRNEGDTVAEIVVNDFDKFDLYVSDDAGIMWTIEDDLGGKYTRGMDHDGTHYWGVINGYTDQLVRFIPGGSSQTWDIPEIGGDQQGSGLAVFPMADGSTGIMLAVFDSPKFFFYKWDGSQLSYLGNAATPFSAEVLVSFGLTYCESTGHFFWTYGPASGYRMVEFSVVISSQALNGTTWGAIKSSF